MHVKFKTGKNWKLDKKLDMVVSEIIQKIILVFETKYTFSLTEL